ncbi:MAG TPA: ADOP family duplicated permease [Vicinamibacterales bacterium]|nr:ADOP family duplicated permease [Vicinamibacterales bacterium]
MSERLPQSPWLARALMGLLLPREEREFLIGDLEETFEARVAAGAKVRTARRWYWRAALTSITTMGRRDRLARDLRLERRRGDGLMKNLLRDARYGLRLLLRKPGVTAVAIITLALGIGANTAIFTVTHALLLKPLPYDRPEQLVVVNENNLSRGWTSFSVSPPNFLDWRAQSQSFASLAAWGGRAFNSAGGGAPERLRGLTGTEGFLEMVGGTPILGRGFRPEEFEQGKGFVVILGHALWQRMFGGRQDVVNQTISLNGQPYTIVGVMHPEWRFGGRDIAVFTPRSFEDGERQSRGAHYLNVVGRLKPGVTVTQAGVELSAIHARLEQQYPDSNKGWGAVVRSLHEVAVGNIRPMLIILLGAVGLVLLVACANLANMHLARATVRAREMAVRTAIGAGRGRIVQQLLTESLVLAVVGGGLGLLVAYWATSALVTAYPTLLPRSSEIRVDGVVLVFTLGLSAVTAVLFGLAPAVSAARTDLVETLKEGARSGGAPSRRRLRSALVVSEVALAIVLLVGAGLLLRSFQKLAQVAPGFETDHRLSVTTLLPVPKYSDGGRVVDFYDRAISRLRALPGVESVALTSTVPISGNDEIYSIAFEGRPPLPPGQGVSALYYLVGPGYFETIGIPLLKGRGFTEEDRAGTPRVAVVNDAFVRLHYPNENPIGQRIRMGRNSSIVREIVGVVGSVKHYNLADKDQAQMYEPFAQMPNLGMSFVLKTALDPASLTASVRHEIQAVDPEQPVAATTPLSRMLADSTALPRIQSILLGVLAGIALVLAAVGLYGVMAYSVSQRTQEIGIRMALGAHRQSVLLMVLRQALVLTGAGLVIGLASAIALGRVMTSILEPLLFQIEPADVTTLVAVPVILTVVAVLAALVPARRATQVDPIQALRSL